LAASLGSWRVTVSCATIFQLFPLAHKIMPQPVVCVLSDPPRMRTSAARAAWESTSQALPLRRTLHHHPDRPTNARLQRRVKRRCCKGACGINDHKIPQFITALPVRPSLPVVCRPSALTDHPPTSFPSSRPQHMTHSGDTEMLPLTTGTLSSTAADHEAGDSVSAPAPPPSALRRSALSVCGMVQSLSSSIRRSCGRCGRPRHVTSLALNDFEWQQS